MARLDQLTDNFMQSFLRNNPKSLVDSNGYLRSEYEEELARRAQPVAEQPTGVPDPRTWRPQFECTGEVAPPAFESPDAQLGITPAELDLPPAKLADMDVQWQRAMDTTPLMAQLIAEGYVTPETALLAEKLADTPAEPPDPIRTDVEEVNAEAQAESAEDELHSEPDGADEHNDHE